MCPEAQAVVPGHTKWTVGAAITDGPGSEPRIREYRFAHFTAAGREDATTVVAAAQLTAAPRLVAANG